MRLASLPVYPVVSLRFFLLLFLLVLVLVLTGCQGQLPAGCPPACGEINLRQPTLTGVNLVNADLSGATLLSANLSEANLRGSNLSGANLSGSRMVGVNLSDANLSGANLRGVNLSGAILDNTNLNGTDLTNAILTRVDLTTANLAAVVFTQARLVGVDLSGANLRGVRLDQADLRGADLTGADLAGAVLSGSSSVDSELRGARLNGAQLVGAELLRVNLSGTDLQDALLIGALLDNITLSGANLSRANLNNATVTNANMAGADLENTVMLNAKLGNVLLDGATLEGTNMQRVDILRLIPILGSADDTPTQTLNVPGAFYNQETIWPDNFTPPQSAVLVELPATPTPVTVAGGDPALGPDGILLGGAAMSTPTATPTQARIDVAAIIAGEDDAEATAEVTPTAVPTATVAPTATRTLEVIRLATQSPLSGPQSRQGTAIRNGTELAIVQYGWRLQQYGYRVELVAYDDEADPEVGVANAEELVRDGRILGLVGHFNSGVALPSSEVYNEHDLVMVSPINTSPSITDRGLPVVNRVCGRDDVEGLIAAEYADRLEVQSVYVVDDSTLYGEVVADIFRQNAEEREISVLGVDSIVPSDESTYDDVVAAVMEAQPQLVYVGGVVMGPFIGRLNEAGYTGRIAGPSGIDSPQIAVEGGDLVVGGFYTLSQLPPDAMGTDAAVDFFVDYVNRFDTSPISGAAEAYDSAMIILRAIENLLARNEGNLPTRAEIAAEVRATEGYQGVTGTISFDANGDRRQTDYAVVEILDSDPARWGGNRVVNQITVPSPLTQAELDAAAESTEEAQAGGGG